MKKKTLILPGVIDIHVHFRDPKETWKEDFFTGTRAALAGGVVCVFDMPNNLEPILSVRKLEEKRKIASRKALCFWGLYFGTDGCNTKEFERAAKKTVGLKLYLGETTGRLEVKEAKLVEKIFAAWPKKKVIVIHSEEEKANLAFSLAKKYGNKIHFTHINSQKLLKKVLQAKKEGLKVTCDTTPHYLFLPEKIQKAKNDFLSSRVLSVKPPLGSREDQRFLWQNLDQIDCLVSDHAPHLLKEKEGENPPSGFPGIETLLPFLLTAVWQGKMSLSDFIRLTNTSPQEIFNFRLPPKTFVEVELGEKSVIEKKNLQTKCGWSPFLGWEVFSKVKGVYLAGKKVWKEGKLLVKRGFGKEIGKKF